MIKKLSALFLMAVLSVAFVPRAQADTPSGSHRSLVIRVFYKGGIEASYWTKENRWETPLLFKHSKTYVKEVKRVTSAGGKVTTKLIPGTITTGVNGMLVQAPNGREKLMVHVSYLVRIRHVTSQGMTIGIPVVVSLRTTGMLVGHRFAYRSGPLAILVMTTSK